MSTRKTPIKRPAKKTKIAKAVGPRLGLFVMDRVSHIKGYITSYTDHLYMQRRYGISPPGEGMLGRHKDRFNMDGDDVVVLNDKEFPPLEPKVAAPTDKSLGDKVKCRLDGFTGIAEGRQISLNGCVRWIVYATELKDGKKIEGYTFDDGQLEIVERAAVAAKVEPVNGCEATTEPSSDR